jgi:hypothetical protein
MAALDLVAKYLFVFVTDTDFTRDTNHFSDFVEYVAGSDVNW